MLVIGATDPADGPDVRTLPAWWWYPVAIARRGAARRGDQRARLARGHADPPGARAARRVVDTVRRVSFLEMLAVAGAGVVAGAVNAIVGSGSLVTFPTLLAVGYPPVTANVSNTVGLVFGGVSGALGYRRELRGQRRRVLTLAVGSAIGALVGGILLLELPDKVFDAVVPILILMSVALMAFKPTPRAGGARPPRPGHRRDVPDRHLRRLLRRRPGRDPARGAADRVRRRPAAPQRGQERAGRGGQRASPPCCSSRSPTSPGRRRR